MSSPPKLAPINPPTPATEWADQAQAALSPPPPPEQQPQLQHPPVRPGYTPTQSTPAVPGSYPGDAPPNPSIYPQLSPSPHTHEGPVHGAKETIHHTAEAYIAPERLDQVEHLVEGVGSTAARYVPRGVASVVSNYWYGSSSSRRSSVDSAKNPKATEAGTATATTSKPNDSGQASLGEPLESVSEPRGASISEPLEKASIGEPLEKETEKEKSTSEPPVKVQSGVSVNNGLEGTEIGNGVQTQTQSIPISAELATQGVQIGNGVQQEEGTEVGNGVEAQTQSAKIAPVPVTNGNGNGVGYDVGEKERAEKEAADKAAAAEKAERDAAEKVAAEKAERDAAEKAAADKAERDAAEKAAAEKAEKAAAEKAAAEKAAAEKAAAEKAEKEKADKDAAEAAALAATAAAGEKEKAAAAEKAQELEHEHEQAPTPAPVAATPTKKGTGDSAYHPALLHPYTPTGTSSVPVPTTTTSPAHNKLSPQTSPSNSMREKRGSFFHKRTNSTASVNSSSGGVRRKVSFMDKVKGEAKVIVGKIERKEGLVEEGRRILHGEDV